MIHPNVFFLILFISCSVVAASLMAEKTNVGVEVLVADNTYMCSFGSDGAAALLSHHKVHSSYSKLCLIPRLKSVQYLQ